MNDGLALTGRRVAFLEDQRMLRESLAVLLEREGLDITVSTGSTSELWMSLEGHPPEVALIDLRLQPARPEDDGESWSLLQRIRQHYPDIRTLVLSGSHDAQDVERCRQAGVSGFLQKDWLGREELLSAIRTVLGGERVFPLMLGGPIEFDSPPPAHATDAAHSSLTSREREVLRYVAAGHDNLKIAALLGISERTVRAHVSSLYRKLGPENRSQMVLAALRMNLVPLSS